LEWNLFKTAEKDLDTSINLYDIGHYSSAIFHLQQSVEKYVKSYGLLEEVIQPKDLKSQIGHLPHKVFTKILEKSIAEATEPKRPLLMAELIPPHQKNVDDSPRLNFLRNTFNRLNSLGVKQMEKFSKSDLEEFINGIHEFEKPEFNDEWLFNLIKEDFVKTQTHFKNYFKNVLNEDDESVVIKLINIYLENPDPFVYQKLIDYKKSRDIEQKQNLIFYALLNLSVITSPHEQTTRYPSPEVGKSPKDYTKDHLLVLYFPKLIKVMLKCIEIFKILYKDKIERINLKSIK
jgi:HEPN domain-containing protein